MSAIDAIRARLPREPGGRIAWQRISEAELIRIIELADQCGDVSVLAGARRALRKRTMP